MATPERDRPRPPLEGIPRGVEVLVKKASVDPEFRALLLEKRAGAAKEIGLELSAAETTMIDTVPAAQLEAVIERTEVTMESRSAFLGRAAAAMLAALGAGSLAGCKRRSEAEEKELKEKARREMEEANRAVESARPGRNRANAQKPGQTPGGARGDRPTTPTQQRTEEQPSGGDVRTTKPLMREFGTLGIQPDRPEDFKIL